MKVVILCGGQGTRLREETEYRPKSMVEIGGRPLLWHLMKVFAQHGLRDFVLCLGYRGHMIKEYFLNYEAMNNDFTINLGQSNQLTYHGLHEEQDFRVTLADTGLNAMTGARVKRVSPYLADETFIVTYGDGLSNIDITALLAFHRQHGRLATVTSVQPPSRFGMLDVSPSGQVRGFAEKPQLKDWVNAGFFVFNRGFLDYLSDDDSCILEHEPLSRLCQDGELMAYHHSGFFYAMDTYREYLHLVNLWEKGDAPWAVWRKP